MTTAKREILACGCVVTVLDTEACAVHKPAAASVPRQRMSLPELNHVGMVAANRDRAVRNFTDRLGYSAAYCIDAPVTAALSTGIVTFQTKLAFIWLGNTLIEVVEPLDNLSPHADFLKSHGEGLHHLAYMVSSIKDELARIGGGRPPRILADGLLEQNPLKWVYIDSEIANGAVVELIERNPVAEEFFDTIYRSVGKKLA